MVNPDRDRGWFRRDNWLRFRYVYWCDWLRFGYMYWSSWLRFGYVYWSRWLRLVLWIIVLNIWICTFSEYFSTRLRALYWLRR
jgi:hypothetical protein